MEEIKKELFIYYSLDKLDDKIDDKIIELTIKQCTMGNDYLRDLIILMELRQKVLIILINATKINNLNLIAKDLEDNLNKYSKELNRYKIILQMDKLQSQIADITSVVSDISNQIKDIAQE